MRSIHRICFIIFFILLIISCEFREGLFYYLGYGNTHVIKGSGNQVCTSIVTDYYGNIYVAGTFEGTVDFDHSDKIVNRTSAGNKDAFLAKYTPEHELKWVYTVGGASDESDVFCVLDYEGNVYLAGCFQDDDIDFNRDSLGNSESDIHDNISAGSKDIFVSQIGQGGYYKKVHLFGSFANDIIVDILFKDDSEDDYMYVLGNYSNNFFYYQSEQIFNAGGSNFDVFLLKLRDEKVHFTRTFNDGDDVLASDMIFGKDDHLYITASFETTINLGPDTSGSDLILNKSFTGNDALFIRMNDQDELYDAEYFGEDGEVIPSYIGVYTQGDYELIYIIGNYSTANDIDLNNSTSFPGSGASYHVFAAMEESNDNGLEAVLAIPGNYVDAEKILITSSHIYFIGNFTGNAYLDDSGNATSSKGNYDTFFNVYTHDEYLRTIHIGGSGEDFGYDFYFDGNKAYFSGSFSDTVNFKYSDDHEDEKHTSKGGTDGFYSIFFP
ncbi:MAG: hypothetical protein MJB14_02470 [Spirochaetes bacterium]|nr:hypothetical protein [Spirochaetota bacterium]